MFSNFFDDKFLLSVDTPFTEENGPSSKSNEELKSLFEGNLDTIRGQTRVANIGSTGDILDPEEAPRASLKNYIVDCIIRKGLRGSLLKKSINEIYGSSFLSKNAKLVASLLDHEWLLGNVFLDLNGYDHCKQVSSVISSSSAEFILPCKSCASCPKNTDNKCTAFDKKIMSSVRDIDFHKYANSKGYGVISSKKDLSDKIKEKVTASEKLSVNVSPNLPSEQALGKKALEYDKILANLDVSCSSLSWDQFKKAYSSLSTEMKLKSFLLGNVREGSLDFNRMFDGCHIEDVKPHYSLLKKVAEKYDQDYSIFSEEVSDYFDIEHVEKKYPTEDEYNARDMVVRTVPQEQDNRLTASVKDSTWEEAKAMFNHIDKKKLMSFFVESKRKSSGLDIVAMFGGSYPEEVKSVLSTKDKILLSKLPRYSEFFESSLSDRLLNMNKRLATFQDSDVTVKPVSRETLDSINARSSLNSVEIKDEFLKCMKKRDLGVLSKYIVNNSVHSSVVIKMANEISNIYPKYKTLCNSLLERLGIDDSLKNFVKNAERTSNRALDGEALYNQIFHGSLEEEEEVLEDNEECLSLEGIGTHGVNFE